MATCPSCTADLPGAPRFCPECGSRVEPAAPGREVRKTVTVLFADLAGSTALGERLDPEAVRTLLTRYFAELRTICEAHGGTVEKFIGDAVMAVFGIPLVHEDDALRAVRAAAEIRDRVTALCAELETGREISLRVRVGVNTGPVVAGDPAAGGTLVTGDPVNTAARLEQAAGPGEVLLGEPTYRLVRDAVKAEPVPPIDAKGKALPLQAWRLDSVSVGAPAHVRSQAGPFLGRERELVKLRSTWDEVTTEHRPHLFTVLGSAGVGKSRLVAEFRSGLEPETQVLRGTCLSYGEGITYWPLREVVHAAAGIDETDDAPTARARLDAILAGERDGPLLASRLAAAVGLSSEPVPGEEIPWAARKLLETLARQAPLVVVWDDLHWAEPTFLDLIEHVADLARDLPILQLAMARPEFLDTRPGWGGGKLGATTILLEPLAAEAAAELLAGLPGGSALPEGLTGRITEAAEGNPLYVEEMLGMLVDEGRLFQASDGRWETQGELGDVSVPPTITALLAARLERLPAEERALAERASVVGRVFEQAAVSELSPEAERSGLTVRLLALVRKELLRPDNSGGLGGDDAYRFRHLLIRDAAYASLPKSERAALHERFAAWLERVAGDRGSEYLEIVAHHLEQAYHYRVELGDGGQGVEELGRRATHALVCSGGGALERADAPGAVALLERAMRLGAFDPRTRLEALELLGRGYQATDQFERGAQTYRDAQAQAKALDDRTAELRLQIREVDARTYDRPALVTRLAQLATAAIDELGPDGDPETLAIAWHQIAVVSGFACRWADAAVASDAAIANAVRAPRITTGRLIGQLGLALILGPEPVHAATARIRALLAAHDGREVRAVMTSCLAMLHYMGGASTEADRDYATSQASLADLAQTFTAAGEAVGYAQMHVRIGSFRRAEELATQALNELDAIGAAVTAVTAAAVVAIARLLDDRDNEVEGLLEMARAADATDIMTQAGWREVAALLASRRGQHDEADRLAREAVTVLAETQAPLDRADAAIVLGYVLRSAGRGEDARDAFLAARSFFEAKGATAFARRVEQVLSEADPR